MQAYDDRPAGSSQQRLDRIETKIDKLAESVTRLGILEERVLNRDLDIKRLAAELEVLETRVQRLEQKSWTQAPAIEWIKTIVLMLLSGLLTLVATRADRLFVEPHPIEMPAKR